MQDKLLVVGPSWIGDALMSQSMLATLVRVRPQCTIHVLANPITQALFERMPEVDQCLPWPLKHGQLGLRTRWRLGRDLVAQDYQQAIVVPNSWKAALVPWWAKIPRRTGWVGECRYGLLNDWRVLNKQRWPLMVQRLVALADPDFPNELALIPKPKLTVQKEHQQQVEHDFHLKQRNERRILALCPGAEYGPAKRWPATHFAVVAKSYLARGWDVWLFGSPKEQSAAQAIQAQCEQRCLDLAGRTSLAEAMDLLSLVDVVVSNDSGLMHLACALEKPVVALFGSSSPDFTPPLSDKVEILSHDEPCSPCFQRTCRFGHLRCLADLAPHRVCLAVERLAA